MVTIRARHKSELIPEGEHLRVLYTDLVDEKVREGAIEIVSWHGERSLLGAPDGPPQRDERACDHICAHPAHIWLDHVTGGVFWCEGLREFANGYPVEGDG